jgi:cellulose synthase/poly-beta-1,6-N-acetylglucosamine synthase-like glycosyltransferase
MCTYNGARFLNEQLESILGQSRLPDELVISDDCSTDETPSLIKSFSASAPFPVRLYFNESNVGSTRNFERAIQYCDGEVISLSDQDDIWHHEKIERTEALFQSRPELGLVFTDADVVDEGAKPLGMTLWQSVGLNPERQGIIRSRKAASLLSQTTLATGATMTFRSRFLPWILPIPGDISLIHDAWIALMISMLAPIEIIPAPLIQYRMHPAQQIGTPLNGSVDRKESRSLREAARRQTEFHPEIRKLKVALARLSTNTDYLTTKEVTDLSQRLHHLQIRAVAQGNRVANLPDVLRELITLRYHRYSNGVFSALKDLLC